jgi:hypothetical protein
VQHVWRVKGRWQGGDVESESEFMVGTRTSEQEDALGAAMRRLVSFALMHHATGPVASVTVDVFDLTYLGEVAEGAA